VVVVVHLVIRTPLALMVGLAAVAAQIVAAHTQDALAATELPAEITAALA
jgi:hypothetical protein